MPPKQYTPEQVMLTLAAITYRGFELVEMDRRKSPLMHDAMDDCLRTLGPVRDQWEIVWGPASFSPFGLGFAGNAAYVVRNRQTPSTFAIAVRGTNPICLLDWIFGDFMVTTQVPWSYGNPQQIAGARIAFSTSLTLSILQHLRSQESAPTPLFNRASELAKGLLPGVAASDVVGHLRDVLTRLAGSAPVADPATLEAWIQDLAKRDPFKMPGSQLNAWDESLERLRTKQLDVTALMTLVVNVEESFISGVDLRGFLAACVEEANDKVDIFVTGHSKGGALSTTLALWLADTQGKENVTPENRWDPTCKATVHAYSFAGPTAGNAQFATHSDAVIGTRCHRIVNQRDIVPYAWTPSDLRLLPSLYSDDPIASAILRVAVEALISKFGALDYKQIGNNVTAFPGIPKFNSFFLEILHQHLDGYFEQMNLDDEMNSLTFFKPLLL